MYNITNYAFKDTPSKDSERFIRIGTQVQRRLLRLRQLTVENEAKVDDTSDNVNMPLAQSNPSFSGDLYRILLDIMANMSKLCCSALMAHFIV